MSEQKQNGALPFAFLKGKIVPIEEANVSIMTNGLQYGNGIFGGIRGYLEKTKSSNNTQTKINIFRISDHYDRFLKSLRILNQTISYTKEQLVKITLELARRNKPTVDCYFRPFAYASHLGFSPDLLHAKFDFALYMVSMGEYLPVSAGLKLMISSWTRISDRSIPARAKICGAYVNSSLAKAEAVSSGFDDAMMLSEDGHISEGSAANFFMVRHGVLVTSPKHSDILEGVTRRSVLKIAKDLGIPTEEREIDRTESYIADEAFLCGTGVQVAWIKEIDGRKLGDGKIGPITEKLQKIFFSIVRGQSEKYHHWLTRID